MGTNDIITSCIGVIVDTKTRNSVTRLTTGIEEWWWWWTGMEVLL